MIHRASFVSADQPLYFSSNVVG